MGLFEKIFASKKELQIPSETFRTLTAYAPAFTSWRGEIYESELVRQAIAAKARHISKLSVRIVGAARPALQTQLRRCPNSWQTWSQFLSRLSTILDAQNTAFIVPVLDRNDDVTGITSVLPSQCSVVQYKGEPYLKLSFSGGQTAAIEMSRVGIMTRYQYRDDFFGESNAAMDTTMDLISIQEQGISEGIKSAATFRFMASMQNFLSEKDLVKERKKFAELNFRDNSDGFLLFPNNYRDVKQIESKPFLVDADQMRMIQGNVFGHVGVSEKIIQNTATADELDSFYSGEIEPFAIQLAEVLSKMLFTPLEQGHGAAVEVAADRLQYMSTTSKVALAKELGDRGGMTIDEMRALFNYPPLPDGAGAMVPIRGEYYNAAAGGDGNG